MIWLLMWLFIWLSNEMLKWLITNWMLMIWHQIGCLHSQIATKPNKYNVINNTSETDEKL